MSRINFALLAVVFFLFLGTVSAAIQYYGGGACGCDNCDDCRTALDDDTNCASIVYVTTATMSHTIAGYCINDPGNFDGGKIFDLNGSTIQGTSSGNGAILSATEDSPIIRNGVISDFGYFGIVLYNVTNARVYNVTLIDNGASAGGLGAGIFLGIDDPATADPYDSYSRIYNCSIVDNEGQGIHLMYADNNEIYNSDLSRNVAAGLWLDCAQDNYIHDTVSDSNTGSAGTGFSCLSAVDRRSSGNNFLRVNASSNAWTGLLAMRCHGSTVNNSRFISNPVGVGVSLGNEGLNDHYVTVVNNYFNANDYGIYVDDIDSDPRSMSVFQNNTVRGSTVVGMFFNNTNNNTISSNTVHSGFWGITLQDAPDNTLSNNRIYSSTGVAFAVIGSTNTEASNTHFYNNLRDLFVAAPSATQQVELYNLIFDSNGAYVDYTNLSIVDSMSSGRSYTATWVASHGTPGDTQSFANKFVNITNVAGPALSIDQLTWYWQNSELPGYLESQFELWEYSSGTWVVMNATPNTAANTLAIYGLNPSSDYAILQNFSKCPIITSSGAYQLQADLEGAPNEIYSTPGTRACVIIAASNVYLDCDGHTISNNVTAATERGIRVNGSTTSTLDNVTIENCGRVQGYYYGLESMNVTHADYNNITFYNINQSAVDAIANKHTKIYNITAFSPDPTNCGMGISVYDTGTTNVSVYDSLVYNCSWGYVVWYYAQNSVVRNNTAFDTGTGFGMRSELGGNTFRDNLAYDSMVGFYSDGVESGSVLANNTARNNDYGFFLAFSPLNAQNNTAFSNVRGVMLETSPSLVMNHTRLWNNSLYDFYANSSYATPYSYVMEDTLFLNPAGTMVNYTNLSIVDTVSAGGRYSINWTANHYALPGQAASFEQKFLDIQRDAGTVAIDQIVWHWNSAEEAGYVPAYFNLLKYNASGWTLVNGTPDTGARTLSAYALNPQSEYGILEYVVNTSVMKIDQTILQPSPGGTVEFNITINNTGNITLADSQVIDELPAGLTYMDATPSPDSQVGQVLTWNDVGSLAPGATATIVLHAEVDYGIIDAGQILYLENYVNTTGTSTFAEEVFGEDYENATIYSANITLLKTDVTAYPPSPGGMVEYQIVVTNIGNVTLDPVEVTDTLPTEFTYSNADPLPDSTAGPIVWNNVGPIAPGATVTILMNATVNSGTPDGVYTNTADTEAQPPNGDSVTASDDVDVGVFVPAIDVVKTASTYSATGGVPFSFNLSITNTGTINLTIWAQDILPHQLEFGGEAEPAPTWFNETTILWNAIFTDVQPGQTVNITYNVTPVSTAISIQNNVLVTGVPPNGDNVTDTTYVVISVHNPPGGGGETEEDECTSDSDCDPCQYCSIADGICKLKSESQCIEDSDCTVEGCTCVDCLFVYPECTSDEQCDEGWSCIDYVCTPPECEEDSDCPTGYTCEDYECVPPECDENSDCPEGYICEDYECTEGGEEPPGGCTSDSDCADALFCVGGDCISVPCPCGTVAAHECTPYECCSDADCPAGSSCDTATHECEEEPEVNETLEVDTPETAEVGKPIVINVTDPDGVPVPGAEVTVIINGKPYSAGTTDENGQVVFTPKESGRYFVEATKPGFADGQDNFQASSAGLGLMEIAAMVLAPLLLLALLAILYILFVAKKKKRKQRGDSED